MNALQLELLESRRLLAVGALPARIGGAGYDAGQRVLNTPDGGYVVAGLFHGKVDFDPSAATRNLTSKGDTDIFLAKYSSAGALQWVDQFGGDEYVDDLSDQDTIDIVADPLRAGGQFINGVGSDPRLVAEYINDLAIDTNGNIYVAGSFLGSVDFDPGAKSKVFTTFDNDYHDAFVLKINGSSGSLGWADRFGDRFTDTANALAIDSSGSIYVTGLFSRTVSFVPGNTSFTRIAEGREDAYVMKLGTRGQVRWVNTFGGDSVKKPERDAGQDIAVDSAGNVFVGGVFTGETDFDPSAKTAIVESEKKSDAVLVKYSTTGKFLKVATWGSRHYEGISTVAVDSNNDVIVAGYFEEDEFDANPGAAVKTLVATPVEPGDDPEFTDLFVEKLSGSTLGFKWVQQLKGTGTEFASEMKIDSNDNILIGGSFYGIAKFGSSTSSLTSTLGVDDFDDSNDNDRENSYDTFLWKLAPAGTTSWVRSFGEAGDDFGAGIDIGPDDAILFTGRFRGTTDFDTTSAVKRLRGLGVADSYVTQFDENGLPV